MFLPMMEDKTIQEYLFLLVKEYGNEEEYYLENSVGLMRYRVKQLTKWVEDMNKAKSKKK